jgi:hypothetical protein
MTETKDDAKKVDPKKVAVKKVAKKPSAKKQAVKKTKVVVEKQESPAPAGEKKPRKAKSPYADILKKQAELDATRKAAKSDLNKKYDDKITEAVAIQVEHNKLVNKSLDSSVGNNASAKKAIRKGNIGFTLDLVKTFIDQTIEVQPVKIHGKNTVGIKKIKAAYDKSKIKEAESVLELPKLN